MDPSPSVSFAISTGRMGSLTAPRARASCSITSPRTPIVSSTSGRETAACSPSPARSSRDRLVAWALISPKSCSRGRRTRFAGDERVELVKHDLARAAARARALRRRRVFVGHPPSRARPRSARSMARSSTCCGPAACSRTSSTWHRPPPPAPGVLCGDRRAARGRGTRPTAYSMCTASSSGCASSASMTSTATGSGSRWHS